ncbi:UDP-N-acetylmuramoyl-L-alanine--D-glutamate ligase [Colwellia sp. 1_MG-2023]|uniref:UDP-N-acetylmuramoyl-L-alanine--D-glutamate ligase n=1 Tax=Colwellia sp. 1_MG-2023 TaxID=3062649 RepID=UPI0026E2C4F6|nr:UDP-N-acetylmuramoyl-L-alanine--D-glutamate ligase [Colwellia sp. 1_MG-2023]MDO6444681.1 UDP-N-acetylmuramoyl-L-alanine--D-glutamate ligase [Colwellia sp. 1_MG-2023]
MLERVIAQLKNKQILVLGAGLTGMSCVRFLAKHQLTCHLNDSRDNIIESDEFSQMFPHCSLSLGAWDHQQIKSAQVILVSPGIDLAAEGLESLIASECQLIGDVELFCQITDKPIVAVTGSNGKSTLVTLLTHIGNSLGHKVALGGNIGVPVLEQLSDEIDCYILELSSFQLETLQSMNAVAASVLNVSDDHLDRHKTLENYSEIKQRIYQQCETAVINRDEPFSFSQVNTQSKPVVSFGSDGGKTGEFGLIRDGASYYLAIGEEKLISLEALPLAGVHNALNYLAALALGHCLGWPVNEMINHLVSFEGLAHRCQRITSTDNIIWINDSKATNVGATLAAINGLSSTLINNKLILIAGGDGKGADFSPLKTAINNTVSFVFTLGKDGEEIARLTKNSQHVASLAEAVSLAKQQANAGDIVLLSPACASIDMFKNFAERGEMFTDAVIALQEAS